MNFCLVIYNLKRYYNGDSQFFYFILNTDDIIKFNLSFQNKWI